MFRGLLERIKGNPLEKLSVRELREEELRLKMELDQVRKSMDSIDKEKKKKFQEGVGADFLKKRMLAREMRGLDTQAKLMLASFNTYFSQYSFISNMLILKQREKELKNTEMWKKLVSLPKEKLQGYLIKAELKGKEFNEMVEELNKLFEREEAKVEREIEEDEKKIFDMWQKVESGALEPEKAEAEISISKELQKEE